MKMRAGVTSILALSVMLGWSAPLAVAQTLTDAMAQAYATNPTLRAARAGQRATDELVPQALSGWRPTVTATGQIEHTEADINPPGPGGEIDSDSTTGTLAITLNQPIFRGFKTLNSTKAAEATVAAGEQGLLATEQAVLFDAVRAYMGVMRGRSVLGLRQSTVGVFGAQLEAAQARFDAGDATRTDISQAQVARCWCPGAGGGGTCEPGRQRGLVRQGDRPRTGQAELSQNAETSGFARCGL